MLFSIKIIVNIEVAIGEGEKFPAQQAALNKSNLRKQYTPSNFSKRTAKVCYDWLTFLRNEREINTIFRPFYICYVNYPAKFLQIVNSLEFLLGISIFPKAEGT